MRHSQGRVGVTLESHPGRGIFFQQKKELETKEAGTGAESPFCDQDRQCLPAQQAAGWGRKGPQDSPEPASGFQGFDLAGPPTPSQVTLLLRLTG